MIDSKIHPRRHGLSIFGGQSGSTKRRLALGLLAAIAVAGGATAAAEGKSAGQRKGNHADARQELIANLRAHVHHVFIVYQENRSFDSYFGSFPGADNLATAEARAHGFRQWDAIGKQ